MVRVDRTDDLQRRLGRERGGKVRTGGRFTRVRFLILAGCPTTKCASSLVISSKFIAYLFKVNSPWLVDSRSWQSSLSDSKFWTVRETEGFLGCHNQWTAKIFAA